MASFTASVPDFSLTSTWYVSSSAQGISASTPDTASADKTFYFTDIPVGSVINSATLTATLGSPATGAALRTVDGGSFSGSKGVSITPGGSNTFRFRFKANGAADLPVGSRSSTLTLSNIVITVDYTPPGGGGGGTPPQGPYIGNLAVSPTAIAAGGSLYIATGACYGNLIRHISIYRSDTNAFVATVVAGYGIEAGAWMFPIPVEWCEFAPNDTQFQIRIELYAHYPDGGWGGVENKTVTIYVPDDIKPTIGSLTAAYNANGVNGAITKYVQNYSKVNLAMGSVSGVYGSSIVSYEITGGGLSSFNSSATLGPFSQSGDITITAKVVDSRGRVGLKTVVISVESYSAVSANNLQAYRSDASKNPADEGAFVTLIGKLVFSSIGGQNAGTIKGRVYEKGTTAPGWTTMADNTLVLFGGSLSVEKAYTAEISVNDRITSYLYSVDIPTGTVIMGIAPNGDGVSFGTYPEAGKVKSAWPIVAPGLAPNPNLLDNHEFTNPINQRGVATGFVSGYSYTYDRWTMSGGAWITIGGTVNLPIYNGTTKFIDQPIEQDLRGRTYTLSVDLVGIGIKFAVLNYPADGAVTQADYNGLTLSLVRIGAWDTVRIVNWNPSVEYQIKRVKLELGTASTMHLDPPMDHAVELPKCQRYYRPLPFGSGRLFISTTSQIELAFDLSPPMRITPSVIVPSLTDIVFSQGDGAYTATSYSVWGNSSQRFVVIRFFGSFPGNLNPKLLYRSDLALSSDL